MENASKALIIAGAILLSILIIALGIYVFNLARSSVNTDQLDNMSIATFNAQFTNYEGKQQGTQVKALLDNVLSNYAKNKDAEERIPVICYKDSFVMGPTFLVGGTHGFGQLSELGNSIRFNNKEPDEYTKRINQLNKNIATSHLYLVKIEKNRKTSLVEKITINYNYNDKT